MTLKTRRPTGRVAPPLILFEGGEKTGKSYACAALSGSPKVGPTYWIEFGEVTADEYGSVPGARYEIVEHDGSFTSLYGAVEDVYAEAAKAREAGDPPVVLVIDSMTAEWDLLKAWATNRAKGSRTNRAKLAQDPNAEIVVSNSYWNDANDRHRKIMRLLMTFPGIAIMIARGKEVSAIGEDGKPIEGKKEYRVEGQKTLGFDASCWVRVSRDAPAMVVGCRSVRSGVRPGIDPPKTLPPDWTLEWLIFEALGFNPAESQVPNLVDPNPERTPEQIRDEAINPGTTFDRLGELFQEARRLGYDTVTMPNERLQDELLTDLIRRLGNERKAAAPAGAELHARMPNRRGEPNRPLLVRARRIGPAPFLLVETRENGPAHACSCRRRRHRRIGNRLGAGARRPSR